MANQVGKKSFWILTQLLALWVTDPGTVDDVLFGIRSDPHQRGEG